MTPLPIPGAIPGAMRESISLLLFVAMPPFLIFEQDHFVRLQFNGDTASGGCSGERNPIRFCGHVWVRWSSSLC